MADLIELDLVVRDKGLKQSVSTVERLERQLIKATKAVEQNRISQDRYNKILLLAKREYQALGVSSQKATAQVRAFAAANKVAQAATSSQTVAINSQNAALQRNAGAAMQTKRQTNQLGVLMQQTGYQVGDFAIQVQSGTNYMVAFGQQATQLIGTFAMLAKSTRMIAIFSGLGIAVPILTAIGAYFVRASESAEDAGDKVKTFEDRLRSSQSAITSVDSAITDLSDKSLESLRKRYGEVTKQVVELEKALKRVEVKALTSEVQEAMNSLFSPEFFTQIESAFGQIGSAIAETTEDDIKDMQAELKVLQDQFDAGILPPESLAVFTQMKEELAAATGDLENMGSLVDELSVSQKVIDTYKELESRIKSATEKGNFEQAADGISRMRKLFEDLGLEVDGGALANMTRLEEVLRQAIASLGKGNVLAMTITKEFGLAADEAQRLATNLQNAAVSSEQVAGTNIAVMTAQMRALSAGQDEYVAGAIVRLGLEKELYKQTLVAAGLSATEAELAADANFKNREALIGVTAEYKALGKSMSQAEKDADKLEKELEALRKELEAPMVKAIDSVSNAFGDFIADGLRDFKSFAKSIVGSFKSMISQMIATAARNKIMLSLGMGGSGFAAQAAAGNVAGVGGNSFGGPLGSMIGSFGAGGGFGGGTGLLGGIGGIASGMSGIFSGGGLSASFANLGGLMSGSVGGMGAIGAALPALGAVAVVIGLLSKKTKLLDSGLRTTVEGFDVAIETFKKTQSSSLFGLLKGSKKTAYEAASAEVADPLIEAIGNMQQSIIDAAGTLGIGANAFDDFSYQFKLSLKGLTEEEQLQKINEEITKMGDSFASLTGHFETMNELLEAANQRMQLQNRLDQLLGNNQAILTRQREAELKAMHELNRPLAQAIYDLEDAQAAVAQANQVVANSFAALRASIDAEKERLQDSFASVLDGLKERLDVVNEALDQSRSIYDMLSNALSSRQVSGEAAFAGRRSSALSFLRGGDFSDERRLENALDVIAEPSESLFSSFIDYARDFARTSITLEEAKKVAQVQLTADEKQVLLLEEQIVSAEATRDAQLDALDQQYQTMVDQYNALLGIDTSVKSVGEAIGTLRSAIESLASAQAASLAAANAAKAAAAVGTGGSSAGVQSASAAGAKVLEQLGQSGVATRASDGAQFKRINIRGSDQLLEVAKSLGIQTSGQTGAQLSQAISNAGNLGVNVDNATRAKQFAMGGYHTGGLRMVGERGPELEATGPSRIFSHNQTSGMFRDPDLKEAVNELRREVSGLRGEQRQMQATNAKYVKRNYDINRKWDVDGLPATRT